MRCKISEIEQTFRGPILLVLISEASGDASTAQSVREDLSREIHRRAPAALLFDFTGSEYEGGDGVCGLIVTVLQRVPAAVISRGLERPRLEYVLGITRLVEVLGGRLFDGRADALEYIRHRLSGSG